MQIFIIMTVFLECSDQHVSCPLWRRTGECTSNNQFIAENCRRSCNLCSQSRHDVCQRVTNTAVTDNSIGSRRGRRRRIFNTMVWSVSIVTIIITLYFNSVWWFIFGMCIVDFFFFEKPVIDFAHLINYHYAYHNS